MLSINKSYKSSLYLKELMLSLLFLYYVLGAMAFFYVLIFFSGVSLISVLVNSKGRVKINVTLFFLFSFGVIGFILNLYQHDSISKKILYAILGLIIGVLYSQYKYRVSFDFLFKFVFCLLVAFNYNSSIFATSSINSVGSFFLIYLLDRSRFISFCKTDFICILFLFSYFFHNDAAMLSVIYACMLCYPLMIRLNRSVVFLFVAIPVVAVVFGLAFYDLILIKLNESTRVYYIDFALELLDFNFIGEYYSSAYQNINWHNSYIGGYFTLGFLFVFIMVLPLLKWRFLSPFSKFLYCIFLLRISTDWVIIGNQMDFLYFSFLFGVLSGRKNYSGNSRIQSGYYYS